MDLQETKSCVAWPYEWITAVSTWRTPHFGLRLLREQRPSPTGVPSTEHCYTSTTSSPSSPRAWLQQSGCVTPGRLPRYLTGDNPCVITCNREHVRRFTLTRDLLWVVAMQVVVPIGGGWNSNRHA